MKDSSEYVCDFCHVAAWDHGYSPTCNDDCGRRWCDDTCAEADGFSAVGVFWSSRSCKHCRGDDVTDTDLLAYYLTRTGVSRESVLGMYLNDREDKR